MSLADIKTKQEQCLNDIYASLEEQGATIPDKKNLVNVAPAIESIEGGSGPKFIDYIESTGTQYIDTGVKPTNNICVEIDFQYLGSNEPNSSWQPFFGFRDYYVKDDNKVKTSFCSYYNISTNELGYHFGPNEGTGTLNSGLNERKFLKYNNVGVFENGNQIITITNSGFETSLDNNTITIFALNINSADKTTGDSFMDPRRIHMKLYSFKVYESDVLIRNFKPCIDPNGVYCLYELVEGKYYYNQGTGSFSGEGIPTQVINYTMLYDGSLGEAGASGANVCADVTGGFTLLCASDTGTVTYNLNNVTFAGNRTKDYTNISLFTNSILSYTDYALLAMYAKLVSYSANAQNAAILSVRDKKGYGNDGEVGSANISIATANTAVNQVNMNTEYVDKNFLYDVDVSSIDLGYANPLIMGAKPTLIIYDLFMLKKDNWQGLCNIANLNSSDYTDEVALCADSIAISTILSNEEAVKYMIYNCTGTFMYYFVRNIDCLTALNNSTYKTLVQANEHWNKFLNMVA